MNKITQFLKEAKQELIKVEWPSRQKTINYTAIVIGISVAVALFLGGWDWIFSTILKSYILK